MIDIKDKILPALWVKLPREGGWDIWQIWTPKFAKSWALLGNPRLQHTETEPTLLISYCQESSIECILFSGRSNTWERMSSMCSIFLKTHQADDSFLFLLWPNGKIVLEIKLAIKQNIILRVEGRNSPLHESKTYIDSLVYRSKSQIGDSFSDTIIFYSPMIDLDLNSFS